MHLKWKMYLFKQFFLVLDTFNLEQDKLGSDFFVSLLRQWTQRKAKPLSWYLKPRIGAN